MSAEHHQTNSGFCTLRTNTVRSSHRRKALADLRKVTRTRSVPSFVQEGEPFCYLTLVAEPGRLGLAPAWIADYNDLEPDALHSEIGGCDHDYARTTCTSLPSGSSWVAWLGLWRCRDLRPPRKWLHGMASPPPGETTLAK